MILESKVLSKNVNNKKDLPKLVSVTKIHLQKDSYNSLLSKLTLKVTLWHFLSNEMEQFLLLVLIFE